MAIQQSINQLLQSTQFAAALYAHQPEVQQKRAEDRELRNLTKEMDEQQEWAQKAAEERSQFLESIGIEPDEHPFTAEEIDEIEANLMPPSIHSPQSMAQMKARRRQLDPEYREQQYQEQLFAGRKKAQKKVKELIIEKGLQEQFKDKVGI